MGFLWITVVNMNKACTTGQNMLVSQQCSLYQTEFHYHKRIETPTILRLKSNLWPIQLRNLKNRSSFRHRWIWPMNSSIRILFLSLPALRASAWPCSHAGSCHRRSCCYCQSESTNSPSHELHALTMLITIAEEKKL